MVTHRFIREQVDLDLGHQDVGAVLVSAAASFDWPAGGYTHMAPGDVALLDTATEGLDVTVLYATTVRPLDTAALRRATETAGTGVVLVEPYLAGTSTAAAHGSTPCRRGSGSVALSPGDGG